MRNIEPDVPIAGPVAVVRPLPGAGLAGRFLVAAVAAGLPVGALALALAGLAPWAGMAAVALYAAVAAVATARIGAYHPFRAVGLPNLVTLGRAALACALVAPALEPSLVDTGAGLAAAIAVAVAVLALDGVDGWAARRLRLASRFGARFDMEVDALFVLILAGLAAATGAAGPWVLALGLIRYAFVAAAAVVPALGRPLAPSFRRKAVCVFQAAALIAVLLPVVGAWIAVLALAAVAWSFAVDARRLLAAAR